MTTFTGDILIQELSDGTFDIVFVNGQSDMTNGLETMSIIAVFGEDYFGNDLVTSESEKMESEFPEVIRRGLVNDETKRNGTNAIQKATAFMVTEKIARSVTVTGEIFSVFGIIWLIEIEAITNETIKYFINWEKGSLTAGLVNN